MIFTLSWLIPAGDAAWASLTCPRWAWPGCAAQGGHWCTSSLPKLQIQGELGLCCCLPALQRGQHSLWTHPWTIHRQNPSCNCHTRKWTKLRECSLQWRGEQAEDLSPCEGLTAQGCRSGMHLAEPAINPNMDSNKKINKLYPQIFFFFFSILLVCDDV